jgi:processing peptidase subunit alpha
LSGFLVNVGTRDEAN